MMALRTLLIIAGLLCLHACATPTRDLVASRREWTVMATSLEVSVYRHQDETAQAAADLEAAYAEIADIDRLMSLYRPDSELSALNAHAGQGPFQLSPRMFEILKASKHYAQISSGAFDTTAQPLVKLWGFYKVDQAAIPSARSVEDALRVVGFNKLSLDVGNNSASLEAGTQIDLGAIAKGYAVDRALNVLRARGVAAALVNLGGNIGVHGQPPGHRPWKVGIQHPREARLIGEIKFWSGAVATSGDYDRYIEVQGKRYSHLIDPRSGWPADGIYALTVIAPNATAADALSTAAFVMGPQAGLDLLASCNGTAGLAIVPANENGETATFDTVLVRTTQSQKVRDPYAVSIDIDQESAVVQNSGQKTKRPIPLRGCIWPISQER